MVRQRDPAQLERDAARRARLRGKRRSGDAGERAKAAFLSMVSHELRTPLNTILGQTDLLAGDNLPPASREAIQAIRDAGHGLHVILNDLLQLAKLESETGRSEQVELDVRVLTEGVRRICRPQAWAQRLDLEIAVDRGVPHRLLADAGRIRQTLINLTGNALKFTERGGVSISAEATPEGNALMFSVSDTGIGIAPEDRHRLFAPFEQIEHVLTRRYGGLGLGLALCKRLVDAMGGEIGVESEPGVGSTFWFTAPVTAIEAHRDSHADHDEFAVDADTMRRAKDLKVLIADDNALHRLALTQLLESAGVAATFVTNGLDAVSAASDAYDAIVLDAHMPLAGGLQAARMIRTLQRHGHTPILLACAEGDPAEAESAPFCDGIVRKPYAARALLEGLILAREGDANAAAFDSRGVEELERSVGRPVLVDILKSFLGSASDMLGRIEEAAPTGDASALEQAARDLAGAAGGLGLAALTAAAKELSAAARLGAPRDRLTSQAHGVLGLGEEARKRLVLLYPDLRTESQAA